MPKVYFSSYFASTFEKAAEVHGAKLMVDLVADFVLWKEQNLNPTRLTDKSSARDSRGRIFLPYQQNQFRHVSFGLRKNGDPVLAFRLLPNGDVMVVCITTKHEMFGLKEQFKRAFATEFPNPQPPKQRP